MTNTALAGIWKFLSLEYLNDDGTINYPFGRDVDGLLIIDARGYFSVHLMDMRRPLFKVPDFRGGTPEEVKTAFESYTGYCGTFDLEESEGRIIFHVKGAWFPNWIRSEQIRYFQINGDCLNITTAPVLFEGKEIVAKLSLNRLA